MIQKRTLEELGWPRLVEYLATRCHTNRGAELALEVGPLGSVEEARARMREIAEARRLTALDAPMPFGGVQDVRRALERADKGGVLSPEELVAVAGCGRGCHRLRRHLEEQKEGAPRLCQEAEEIEDLGHVFFPILESFDPDGALADHASDALGPLRREAVRLKGRLEQRARSMVEELSRFLQDDFYTQREERYVLPVKVESRGSVSGIVHGTSQSGQTVFVEPDEIVDLNNQLKLAECEVADEERRVLRQLTGYVAEECEALRRALATAARLDLIAAAAALADDLEGGEPEIDDEGRLELSRARHPLMVLGGRPCVANDIHLEPGTILVLSGPNAGGKTVALKTVGLCAAMARAGLHLPATSGSRVPWYLGIDAAIGDAQSLEADLSTFSGHLLELRRFLEEGNERTLLLIDELCSATEPEQGAALARAVLEALADRRVPALVTTHYERLKSLAVEDDRFANASVGLDLERLEPTFRVHLGVPGSSGALDLARRLGLGRAVDRARELLGGERASVEDMLKELAEERERLEAERVELSRARGEAERARGEAELLARRLREEKRRLHEKSHSEAVAALREARLELDRIRSSLKREKSRAKLVETGRRIDKLARKVAEGAPEGEAPPGRPATEAALTPGTVVYVSGLGGRGEVVAPPERGRVTVQVGALRTTAEVSEVRLVEEPQAAPARPRPAPRARPAPREPRADQAPPRTGEATLDLRGRRVDEALAEVDRFLDRGLLEGKDVVFLIHGHGTGALRSAVREQLAAHPAVARHRPGEPAEGGDGVTVVWLDR